MAQSPSHRFGQMIGEILEATIQAPLASVCRDYDLYLDVHHSRAARSGHSKVSWTDLKGNSHDLDFVVEQGGSELVVGLPRAFIEIAWRRYTKHSRNKAQEIQGAVLPLAETYRDHRPFLGVVLAGVFTEVSLNQLRSHNFQVLYLPYESILNAFAKVGIDAAFDESTTDNELAKKVAQLEALSTRQLSRVSAALR